ncbi:BatA domain-containing protein [Fulvivirga sediminis]|uniref:BatA domain-containing protein n=1 Tax=Fulvivirga sediminis TaxID=2803949 RepID=A0A937F855_9BACT|nr:BatA domain-containing protein [Fulvivirga sediminis]MBL3658086.1 BatA domain-containing protein [Fulvivirga sediminis]
MNFIYPQFLYGLFALAIPVIIHLFNFRKTKRVYFSNTRFLKKVKDASSAKRKLKHYLILASRLAFIFFLVIAFAQPFIPSEEDADASTQTLIYLDNSLSMSNEVAESISAFDEAVSYVNTLADIYSASHEYKILTNDFNSYSNSFKSKGDISDLTTEIRLNGITRSWEEVKDRLLLDLEQGQSYEVFWISDFQSSTSGNPNTMTYDSGFHVNLIPLNFTSHNNVYVDSVYLDNPFLIGDQKLKLNVVLRNIGADEVTDLIVKVFVDEVQSATSSVDLSPNGKSTTTFDLAIDLKGDNKCRISFEDFPVTFDNDFYFTINGSQKIDVLEIKNQQKLTNIESVYGNEKLFNFKSFSYSNLDYNLIPEADLVVVNELDRIDPSLAGALNQYISNYGHVVFIPSVTPDIDSYHQLQQLGRVSRADSISKMAMASPDFEDPFYENVFEEENVNVVMPEASPIIHWGNDRTALLRFRSGTPFLSRLGTRGGVYVFASPFSEEYTNFQTHALFVPIMYRAAVESASAENRLYNFIDNPVLTFKTDTLSNTDDVFKLVRDGEEMIPIQRISGNVAYLEAPKFFLSSGFYDLTFQGRKITSLAFNNSPAESDLRQINNEELKRLFDGDVSMLSVDNNDQFRGELEKKYIGQSLWKYAVILALLCLLMEVLLIRFLP